ncbi:MAG: L-2,4-diaminobutyrate decarboxylase [Candidatus Heimdallarchaeota archaeon LC_2]|nr:MAG: L-2,4-diaminobutyrate decarboxylase [Candidatus Heimdallarchaeota archaeon LC_2]
MANNLTLPRKEELENILNYISEESKKYIESLDSLSVRQQGFSEVLRDFDIPFPEFGKGGIATLSKLINPGLRASVASSGPRFFHFVVGGVTPAALGAEWISAVTSQISYAYITSPLAVKLELISLNWLKELFEIPKSWGGIMTTGATMAIYVGLIAARQWLGEQYKIDIFEDGMSKLPETKIFASKLLHPSDSKVIGMLGLGRKSIVTIADNKRGAFDIPKLEEELQKLNGTPCIVVAVAGEPNAGLFDPVPELAKLSEKYNMWLHVDGAFGLFAKVDSRTKHLLDGLEKADSIAVDGHKWLNVPYDIGFGFVKDRTYMEKSFRYSAEYLPDWNEEEPVLGMLGPESSRKARSLPVWATLHAYGKSGIVSMIGKHINQALFLEKLVKQSLILELLEDVVINVVCFRYNPGGMDEGELDYFNNQLGKAILDDGRVFLGTTIYQGKVALRPAIVNWRTENSDIEFMVNVILDLAQSINKQE